MRGADRHAARFVNARDIWPHPLEEFHQVARRGRIREKFRQRGFIIFIVEYNGADIRNSMRCFHKRKRSLSKNLFSLSPAMTIRRDNLEGCNSFLYS